MIVRRLNAIGLGSRRLVVGRNETVSSFSSKVGCLFPELGGSSFQFFVAKLKERHKLQCINFTSVRDLKSKVKFSLYIRPDRPLRNRNVAEEQDSDDELYDPALTHDFAEVTVAPQNPSLATSQSERQDDAPIPQLATPRPRNTTRTSTHRRRASGTSSNRIDTLPPNVPSNASLATSQSERQDDAPIPQLATARPRNMLRLNSRQSSAGINRPNEIGNRSRRTAAIQAENFIHAVVVDRISDEEIISDEELNTSSIDEDPEIGLQQSQDESVSNLNVNEDPEIRFHRSQDNLASNLNVNENVDEADLDETLIYDPRNQVNGTQVDHDLQRAMTVLKASYLEMEEKTLVIRRNFIVEDVLKYYSDSDILGYTIKVSFDGEMGEDLGGLTKDMFFGFWNKVTNEFFKGEDTIIPAIPVNKQLEANVIFPAIGRVLCHMISILGVIPPNLCRSTLLSVLFDEEVNKELLYQDFLSYISMPERRLIKRLLGSTSWSPRDKDMIVSMFHTYGMHSMPSVQNFKNQILNMASSELLDKPMKLFTLVKKGFPELFLESFFMQLTPARLTSLYSVLLPTPEKVIQCIKTEEEMTYEQEVAVYFLKNFLQEISTDTLKDFLAFVTGSTLMPLDGIKVTFNSTVGLNRCPRTHTCGNIFELPTTYMSYQELKKDLWTVLKCDEAYEMNAI